MESYNNNNQKLYFSMSEISIDSSKEYRFCSQKEFKVRQKQFDVHFLEATDATKSLPPSLRVMDPCRAVRRFYRPGTENLHLTSVDRRSIFQLEDTLNYLCSLWHLHVVKKNPAQRLEGCVLCYSFLMDRISGVRQDMINQSGLMLQLLLTYRHIVSIYTEMYSLISSLDVDSSDTSKLVWYDESLLKSAIRAVLSTALCLIETSINNEQRDELSPLVDEFLAYFMLFHQTERLQDVIEQSLVVTKSSNHRSQLSRCFDLAISSSFLLGYSKLYSLCLDSSKYVLFSWKLTTFIHQRNPARALREIRDFVADSSILSHLISVIEYELRVWRLLLADGSANKDDKIHILALSKKLCFTDVNKCWELLNNFMGHLSISRYEEDENYLILNDSKPRNYVKKDGRYLVRTLWGNAM